MPAESSRLEGLEERELIRRAQRGERAAFDTLVRRYEQDVLSLALRVVRSPDEVRDIYQEAFLKIYRSLPRFRLEARFSTWMYRIVVNVCLDHLRRQSARREVQALESDGGDELAYFRSLPDERPIHNPERAVRSGEIAHRIESALERLTPRERIVFELRHYQGLKLRHIGEICGTTEETAKNRLFRATQKVRAELKDLVGK